MDDLGFLTSLMPSAVLFGTPEKITPVILKNGQSTKKDKVPSTTPLVAAQLTPTIVEELLGCNYSVDCFIHKLGLYKIDLHDDKNTDLVGKLVEKVVDEGAKDILIELLTTDAGSKKYVAYTSGKPENDFVKEMNAYLPKSVAIPTRPAKAQGAAPGAAPGPASGAAPGPAPVKGQPQVSQITFNWVKTYPNIIDFLRFTGQSTPPSPTGPPTDFKLILVASGVPDLTPGDVLIAAKTKDGSNGGGGSIVGAPVEAVWKWLTETHKTSDLILTFERTQLGGKRKRTYKNSKRGRMTRKK